MRLVVGGYGPSLGLVDLDGTDWQETVAAAPAPRASWVLPSPGGRHVYAVIERQDGGVGAWSVTADRPWRPLGTQETGGADPCHLALSPDGRWLLAANYTSGSVCVLPVAADGSLGARTDLVVLEGPTGPVPGRLDGAHAHEVVFAPDGTVFVCDLGRDVVHGFTLDGATGRLTEAARSPFPPGTGPRHLVLTADGATAYVVGELSGAVSVCRVDGPRLEVLQTVSARAADASGDNTGAELSLSGDERTLVVSQRGDDTVATLEVDRRTARLVAVDPCGGAGPRWIGLVSFAGSDELLLVAHERSDSLAVLRRDGPGWSVATSTTWDRPTCVATLPDS